MELPELRGHELRPLQTAAEALHEVGAKRLHGVRVGVRVDEAPILRRQQVLELKSIRNHSKPVKTSENDQKRSNSLGRATL